VDRRSRTRKVIDLIDLEKDRLGDIVPDQLKMMVVEQIRDILLAASEEIIETNNVVALREQSFTKMRANKPGTAGNKNSHNEQMQTGHELHEFTQIFALFY
jgi:hypothetical protein